VSDRGLVLGWASKSFVVVVAFVVFAAAGVLLW
jgi:hypothetical protein